MRNFIIDDDVKFHDPEFSRSGEIRLQVVGDGIFLQVFFRGNSRREVANYVICSVIARPTRPWYQQGMGEADRLHLAPADTKPSRGSSIWMPV